MHPMPDKLSKYLLDLKKKSFELEAPFVDAPTLGY